MKTDELNKDEMEHYAILYLYMVVLPKAIKITLKDKPKCYKRLIKNVNKIINKPKFISKFMKDLKKCGLEYNPNINADSFKIKDL